MTAREVGGLVVQECSKCHGIWAPENVFEGLVDRATTLARERLVEGESAAPRVDGGNPAATRVEYRRCPCCDALMGRRNFRKRSGVIIDRCHEHGTWLDANELERIAGFVLSGRAETLARFEASERAQGERQDARAAAQRAQMSGLGYGDRDSSGFGSVFGTRRETGTVGTILDLLNTLLR
jgi:Zn-finger nucleic acid-binding protein